MKLQEQLKDLILEVASIDTIKDCIKKRQVCVIYYEGDEPGGKGLRLIEPVCLGRMAGTNNMSVRAWDIEGASHTDYKGEQPLPGWRVFNVNKILSIKPTGDIFDTMRPGYNINGDKSMSSVIINAKF